MDLGFLIIIGVFVIYYLLVLISEKRMISEAGDIIDKFLSVLLLYVAISIIYYSLTGQAFLSDNEDTYAVYIFIIGVVALLWAIPNLLKEFRFFNSFLKKGERLKRKRSKKRRWSTI